MSRMITVQIDSDDMIEMLMDRLSAYWLKTSLGEEYDLWLQYYTDAVENGYYDGSDFNIAEIVDNDYVNYINFMDRESCIDEYGFDPEEDEDGRVLATDGEYYLISAV